MSIDHPLFIALDMSTEQEAITFLEQFGSERPAVKVGMELFYSAGPDILLKLKERGHHLFLDVKCHDIPKTVERTMKKIASYGVDVVTTHASGGREMMEAAREGLEQGVNRGSKRPTCIAVTVLTSTSAQQLEQEMLICKSLPEAVRRFTEVTLQAGLDGVVCSVQEVKELCAAFPDQLYTLTPGIRNKDDNHHDQKRAATPEEASKVGSSAIVVGRAITRSEQPLSAYYDILHAWTGKEIKGISK